MTRAPTIVSQGPATTRPAMIANTPARIDAGLADRAPRWPMSLSTRGRPATRRPSSEQDQPVGRGGRGVIRRVTPSGEMLHPAQREPGRDRRGDRDADRDEQHVDQAQRQVAGEERVTGERDRRDQRARNAQNSPKPTRDADDGGDASTRRSAIVEICRGVAPTRRIAAKRCSRRAADSRVAPADEDQHGEQQRRRRPPTSTSVMPFASVPTSGRSRRRSRSGDVVLIRVTSWAPGSCASESARRPMTMIRCRARAARPAPIVPTSAPG